MEKPKVKLTIGISNSGKSYWTRQFIKENPHYTEFNRDEIRIMQFCNGDRSLYSSYTFKSFKENLVSVIQFAGAEEALKAGRGVVISDTNLNKGFRRKWEQLAAKYKVPYEEVVFDTPLHVCKARSIKRDVTVPMSVLERQQVAFREYLGKKQYTGTEGAPKAVIFDVDGTLADMIGVRSPFDWDNVGLDKPRANVIELSQLLAKAGYKIIVLSGRDGVCIEATRKWLVDNKVPFKHLYQRAKGDQRPDAEIKEELFWKHVANCYDVRYVVDDRNQMVDGWRAMGLECWQVQTGDF